MKNILKKTICLAACAAYTFSASGICSEAAYGSKAESFSASIDTLEKRTPISRYIYGINDVYGLDDVTVYSVKQSDPSISSYNWEINASNSTDPNGFENNLDLVKSYSSKKRSEPALLAKKLIERSEKYNIPSRYITLQMMGFVANDSNGIVSPDDIEKRFATVRCVKNDSLLTAPDIYDNTVYMDEYISSLVYNYGSAEDGGINGYFLDYEPENWSILYPALVTEQLTAETLLSKSVSLANAAKKIDPTALIYGPSIGGLESFVNLKNQNDWEQYKSTYSWFIDYYLDKMSKASEQTGTRLLDVLDLHLISEARSVILEPIVGTNSITANSERLQAPRILWDANYTENSTNAILYKQHTPIIPTIQASIRMYFPETKLSFSEYNFGGGDDISGGIAQADTLGIFGEQNVYMACLMPDSEDFFYQKSGINIYTNYDGEGSSYGNIAVSADNNGNNDCSVYASVSSEDESELKIIFINKLASEKETEIAISSAFDYDYANLYSFNAEHSDIIAADEPVKVTDCTLNFTAEPLSVTLIELKCEEIFDDPDPDADSENVSTTRKSTSTATQDHEHVEVTAQTKQSSDISASTEIQSSVSVLGTDDYGETITSIVTEIVTVSSDETEITEIKKEQEEKNVPKAVKIIGIVLTIAVAAAAVFVLIDDGHEKKEK